MGVLKIADSTFTANSAGVSGGAVYYGFAATALEVTDSTFSTNTAPAGGAIYTATGTTLSGATFTGNAATSGGAVDVAGSLTGTNSTFASNTAGSGGALYSKGTLESVNSTIAYNQASVTGGGIDVAGGTASLYNTLVALNTLGSERELAKRDRRHADRRFERSGRQRILRRWSRERLERQPGRSIAGNRRGPWEQRRSHPDDRATGGQPGDRRGQQLDHGRARTHDRPARRLRGPLD